MRRIHGLVVAGVMACVVAACNNDLNVENPNNPETTRALARPTDVENLIIGSYNTFHGATYRFDGTAPQLMCLGLENYSNLANSAMGIRSAIPRPPIANGRNATGTTESYNPWLGLHRAARAAALGLSKVNDANFTFFPTSTTQNERAKAFAHFVIGISMGELAMAYDSATIVTEKDNIAPGAPLILMVHNDSVARYALARLDSAYKHAGLAGTQTIPLTWMATATGGTIASTGLTMTQFQGLIDGWKARIMASVAQSPADPIVNWDSVIADATKFISAYGTDVVMAMSTSAGWDNGNMAQLYASGSTNWHEMHGFIVGMADTSGNYLNWLQSSFGSTGFRNDIVIVTPDKRFPSGGATCNTANPSSACRLAQQCANATQASGSTCPAGTVAGTYFQNRATGGDWAGDLFGNSEYRDQRNLGWFNTSGRAANYTIMPIAELRLLAAEAWIRKNVPANAVPLIDASRTAAGLGSVAGLLTLTDTTTGANCVPRVPTFNGATSVTHCPNLLEAMKWEKRMETAYTWWGTWYFDGRRWGDLPIGTPTTFPVPYQESDTRNTSNFYATGGAGPTAMPTGTYGL